MTINLNDKYPRSLGMELAAVQNEIKEQQKKNMASSTATDCFEGIISYDQFIKELNFSSMPSEITIIRNLYNNAPTRRHEYEMELLTITKNMAYNENIFHYNEIYAIVAYLHDMGIGADNLYIEGCPSDGVYDLASLYTEDHHYIVVKNRKTKWMFAKKGLFYKNAFAGFCELEETTKGIVYRNKPIGRAVRASL